MVARELMYVRKSNRENLENVAFRGESFKEGLVYNVRCQREVK